MTTLELDSLTSPAPEASPARPARAAAKRPRAAYNAAMKLLRRAHLYSGLFMTPWVFLYGGTALLFNHPDLFSGREVIEVGPAELAGTPLAQAPRPDDLAARVVEKLNAADPSAGYRRTPGDAARYAQPLTAAFNRGGKPYHLRLDLATLDGAVREGALRQGRGGGGSGPERPAGEQGTADRGGPGGGAGEAGGDGERGSSGERGRGGERRGRRGPQTRESTGSAAATVAAASGAGPASQPTGSAGSAGTATGPAGQTAAAGTAGRRVTVDLDLPAFKLAGEAVPAVLAKLNVAPTDLAVRPIPELTFAVDDAAGKTWRARFDPATGGVGTTPVAPAGEREPPAARQFLLNLHKAHGYPAAFGPRWAWAVAVDAMFLSMCGWGLTGLLMWWQMKNMRAVGCVILALSAATATVTIVAMHGAMTG